MNIEELRDIPEKICENCHEIELAPWKFAKDPFAGYCDFCKTKDGVLKKQEDALRQYQTFVDRVKEFLEPAVF